MSSSNVLELPPREELDPERDLAAEVRSLMAAEGLSQSRVGKETGLSGPAISQWLSGKYPADTAALEAKVRRWLGSRTERNEFAARLPDAPAWVATPTSRRILAALSYSQLAGDIAVIYGGAGVGKTISLRRYAADHPNVWVATMTAATGTLGSCLERVAQACGVRSPNGRPARVEGEIVDRLTDSAGLLIIDEAQHLQTRALEAVRALHDASGVGLGIVGNELVYARITGGRRSAEFAQLFSRIGKRVRLARPTLADVEGLLTAWGISGSRETEMLREIARGPGALRVLTKTLRLASLFAGGDELNADHLAAAWRDLGGDL